MTPTVYHLQKPHLNGREADWLGHPGKNEAFLQGVLIHNTLAWICVKAGWVPTANSQFRKLLISLQDAGYPRSWGQGFKAIAHVAPGLVPLPPADQLPRLMTEFAATRPVILTWFCHLL